MTQAQKICMWRRSLVWSGLGLSLMVFTPLLKAAEPSLRLTSTVRAIQQAEPAVVNIEGNKPANPSASDSQLVNGMGAGVIIDSRGYILTNQHVVQDVGRIEVTLHDGTQYVGRLIARDAETDLALVKITAKQALPVIRCGTSSTLMRGEPVIAIGNPFGYHHTVTEGIISALHRDIPVNGAQNYPDLIQTDASINPGNSGGPLLNADGDMIGINAAVRIGAQGIGFAIPVDRATEVAAEMIAQHRSNSIDIPVGVSTKHDQGGSRAVVVRTSSDGLRTGDVITAIGDRKIKNRLDFELALLGYDAGSNLKVDVERNGTRLDSQLELESRTASRVQFASTGSVRDQVYRTIGVRLEAANAAEVRRVDPSYKGGLRITAVRHNSPAYMAQIQAGDVLVGLMEWQTPDWEDLAWIIKSSEMRTATDPKFHIMRGQDVFWGTLDMQAPTLK
jgi:serine protease Do